jgi:hypothetical protein
MSLTLSRLTIEATLRRTTSSGVDEYGNPELVEATEAVLCHVRPLTSDELGSAVGVDRRKLYLSPEETLAVSDRVTVGGELFEVVTGPRLAYNPRTRLDEALVCEIEARS